MSLTDIMSNADLSGYTQIALIIFFVLFMAIVIYLYGIRSKSSWDRLSRLPLQHDRDSGPVEGKQG